jgi:hypothetical protein
MARSPHGSLPAPGAGHLPARGLSSLFAAPNSPRPRAFKRVKGGYRVRGRPSVLVGGRPRSSLMPGRSWAPAPARSAGPATRPRGARVGRCRPDPRGARKATRHRRPSGELPRSGWSRPSQYALWTKWRARHRSVRDAEGPTRQHRVQEGRRRSKPHTGGQPSAAGAAAGGVKSTSTMRSSPPPRHDHGQRDLRSLRGRQRDHRPWRQGGRRCVHRRG